MAERLALVRASGKERALDSPKRRKRREKEHSSSFLPKRRQSALSGFCLAQTFQALIEKERDIYASLLFVVSQ